MTYIDYKHKIEFEHEEYDEIANYCSRLNLNWFASVWDKPSVDFMLEYTDIAKIPSALITDEQLIKYARSKFKTLIISTGMSDEIQIEKAVADCDPDIIMHTNSAYPSQYRELNLNYIKHLQEKYPKKEIGYSGHEYGLVTTFATAALGSTWIERHITLDRTMWGSDQLASVEPSGLIKLVKGIRNIEISMGSGGPRKIIGSELAKLESLRPKEK